MYRWISALAWWAFLSMDDEEMIWLEIERDSPSRALPAFSTSLRIAVDVVYWLFPDFVLV